MASPAQISLPQDAHPTLPDAAVINAQAQGQPSHAPAAHAVAANALTPEQITEGRRQMLEALLKGPNVAPLAHKFRDRCLHLNMPAQTADDQKSDPLDLSATELCVGALTRQGRDGAILSTYQEMIDKENAGKPGAGKADPAAATALVQRIVDSIKSGDNVYSLTPDMAGHVTSGLAMDAGFTAAWLNKGEGLSGTVSDEAKLHDATERCTSQQGDNKICLAVGFVQGSRAYRGANQTAALDR